MAAGTPLRSDEHRLKQIKTEKIDVAIFSADDPIPIEIINRMRELAELLPNSYEKRLNELCDTFLITAKPNDVVAASQNETKQLIEAAYRSLDRVLAQFKPARGDPDDLTGRAPVDAALLMRRFMRAVLDKDETMQEEIFRQFSTIQPMDLITDTDSEAINTQVLDTIRSTLQKPEKPFSFASPGTVSQLSKTVESRVAFLMNGRQFYDGIESSKSHMSLAELIGNLKIIQDEFDLTDQLMYILLRRHTSGTALGLITACENDGSSIREALNSLRMTYGITLSSGDAFTHLQYMLEMPPYRSLSRNLAYINTLSRQSTHLNILFSGEKHVESRVALVLNLQWSYSFMLKYYPETPVKELYSQFTATLRADESGTNAYSRLCNMSVNRFGSNMTPDIMVKEDMATMRGRQPTNVHHVSSEIRNNPMANAMGLPVPLGQQATRPRDQFLPRRPNMGSQRSMSRQGRGNMRDDRKCNHCNKPGHFWRSCFLYKNLSPTDRVCKHCGGKHPGECRSSGSTQVHEITSPQIEFVNEIRTVDISSTITRMRVEIQITCLVLALIAFTFLTIGPYTVAAMLACMTFNVDCRLELMMIVSCLYNIIRMMTNHMKRFTGMVNGRLDRIITEVVPWLYGNELIQASPEIEEIMTSMENDRPLIVGRVFDMDVRFLIDTGSSQNILSEETFEMLDCIVGTIERLHSSIELLAHNMT